ncbi:MAG: hypothetical protein ACK45D_17970, partial [Alphaproteobacteria bacterium]
RHLRLEGRAMVPAGSSRHGVSCSRHHAALRQKIHLSQMCRFPEPALHLAREIYSDLIFRPYSVLREAWDTKPHRAFQDAVMIGLSERLEHSYALKERSFDIIEATKELFAKFPDGTFTGRGNTKQDIKDRIQLYREMLSRVLG